MANDDITSVVEETVVEVVKKGKRAAKNTDKSVPVASTSTSVVEKTDKTEEFDLLKKLVEDLSERVRILEEKIESREQIEKEEPVKVSKKDKEPKEEKKPRAPTAYNIFMKNKMNELKETNPELNNVERMKKAAEAWSESKKVEQ